MEDIVMTFGLPMDWPGENLRQSESVKPSGREASSLPGVPTAAEGAESVIFDVCFKDDGTADVADLLAQALAKDWLVNGWIGGSIAAQWRSLAWLSAVDVAAARAIEPHWDAQNILAQSGAALEPSLATRSWGVYAASGGNLKASQSGDRLIISGEKPWCSLASILDWALVTVPVAEGTQLVAIDLTQKGVSLSDQNWSPAGLREIESSGIVLTEATGHSVGAPDWYLERPGFAWGGIGVAAAWYGGMVSILHAGRAAAARRDPDQLALAAIGEGRRLEVAALNQLQSAAHLIDTLQLNDRESAWSLALAIRGNIASWAYRSIELTKRIVGPAGLAFNPKLTKRIQDLDLYLSQARGARDDASLGQRLVAPKEDRHGQI